MLLIYFCFPVIFCLFCGCEFLKAIHNLLNSFAIRYMVVSDCKDNKI
jgi:hypothetical protein